VARFGGIPLASRWLGRKAAAPVGSGQALLGRSLGGQPRLADGSRKYVYAQSGPDDQAPS